ncbi:MAG: response regulator, partial [Geminicoccaceae bacterium]
AAKPTPDAGAGIVPAGLRALVAEDEPLLAHDLARQLETLGIGDAAVVDSVEELQRTLERPELHLDLAVLDINLSGQPSFPLADLLLTRNVPVLFVTGYGELPGIYQTGHPRVRLLRKPLVPADLAQAIAALLAPGQARDAPRVERTRMAGT